MDTFATVLAVARSRWLYRAHGILGRPGPASIHPQIPPNHSVDI
ncbi:hypothetical protein [Burkholderia cenocepacia]|nr:hypothetical protein [Burkholderia cenocepacia]